MVRGIIIISFESIMSFLYDSFYDSFYDTDRL